MKLNKILTGISIIAILVTAVGAPALAFGGKCGAGDKCAAIEKRMAKDLDLTPEQQVKLEENRKARREEMKKLLEDLKSKHAELREEMKKPSVTRATVEPLLTEIKSLQAKMVDKRVDGILSVKSILTPEQFAKFQQLIEKKIEKGKSCRFHRRGWFRR